MRNPYQRKAATKSQKTAFDPQQLYKQYIEAIVANAGIFALYQDGWALCATPTGQRAFACWQSKGLARLLIKDNWANYHVEEVPLMMLIEKLIPFLKENNTMLSLDLTPEGNNLLVTPETFLMDIKNFLYQIYIQRPDVFAELKLPLPRDIRLHS